jgi:phosphate transporter
MSLLAFAVTLWITQAIPYYVTGLLVPILIVLMNVLKDPKTPGKVMSRVVLLQ